MYKLLFCVFKLIKYIIFNVFRFVVQFNSTMHQINKYLYKVCNIGTNFKEGAIEVFVQVCFNSYMIQQ